MWSSFSGAFRGLVRAWKTQANFRLEMLIALVVVAAGALLHVSFWEWLVLVAAITAMLVLELINTVAELLCDLLTPRLHGAVAMVKEVAAAAVLIGAVGVAVIGFLVFLPHLV